MKEALFLANYFFHFNTAIEPSYPFWDHGAAGKCHLDRELIAQDLGFSRIDCFTYEWANEPTDTLNARLDGLLGGLQHTDCLIVQWAFPPAFNHRWIQAFINRVHLFGAKLVFLIDDMASWRYRPILPDPEKDDLDYYLRDVNVNLEITFLNQADGLIVHSEAMANHLKAQFALFDQELMGAITWYGPSVNRIRYFHTKRRFDQGVDYAGALYKAAFLQQLPNKFPLNIYGARPEDKKLTENKAIKLHTRVDPEAISQMLEGSYGLVWDSESFPGVVGSLGQYERYNTPAKFPMYLSANEPVIVWSQASTANFVKDNQVGLVLDSLDQLPQAVQSVTEDQYQKMIANVERISPLIRDGFFLKKAILDVMDMIYVHAI